MLTYINSNTPKTMLGFVGIKKIMVKQIITKKQQMWGGGEGRKKRGGQRKYIELWKPN